LVTFHEALSNATARHFERIQVELEAIAKLRLLRSLGGGWKAAVVAVGTAITDRPPHRPVRALLTHTVLASDIGMFGVKTHVGIRLQDLDRW
jgi:soluble P-type ATPase